MLCQFAGRLRKKPVLFDRFEIAPYELPIRNLRPTRNSSARASYSKLSTDSKQLYELSFEIPIFVYLLRDIDLAESQHEATDLSLQPSS
jgi:hypothetical protein